jgi:hypothetical protein
MQHAAADSERKKKAAFVVYTCIRRKSSREREKERERKRKRKRKRERERDRERERERERERIDNFSLPYNGLLLR